MLNGYILKRTLLREKSQSKKHIFFLSLFLLDDDETGYDNTDVNLLHMSSIGMRDGHLFMIHWISPDFSLLRQSDCHLIWTMLAFKIQHRTWNILFSHSWGNSSEMRFLQSRQIFHLHTTKTFVLNSLRSNHYTESFQQKKKKNCPAQ